MNQMYCTNACEHFEPDVLYDRRRTIKGGGKLSHLDGNKRRSDNKMAKFDRVTNRSEDWGTLRVDGSGGGDGGGRGRGRGRSKVKSTPIGTKWKEEEKEEKEEEEEDEAEEVE